MNIQPKNAMPVGLFIPCYIDQFYPQVGIATLRLLESLGLAVDYPAHQTCCGQPMANAGSFKDAEQAAGNHIRIFKDYEHVVCPSGSCVCFIREHYGFMKETSGSEAVRQNTYELCEFLTDVLCVQELPVRFPYVVGIHNSCHGLRGLGLGKSSELVGRPFSKIRHLLSMVEGIELATLEREDECCGFGGMFAVNEEAVSCKMGKDRIADHERAGVQVITGADMSCLMHLEGLIRRENKSMRVLHVAEILAGMEP